MGAMIIKVLLALWPFLKEIALDGVQHKRERRARKVSLVVLFLILVIIFTTIDSIVEWKKSIANNIANVSTQPPQLPPTNNHTVVISREEELIRKINETQHALVILLTDQKSDAKEKIRLMNELADLRGQLQLLRGDVRSNSSEGMSITKPNSQVYDRLLSIKRETDN